MGFPDHPVNTDSVVQSAAVTGQWQPVFFDHTVAHGLRARSEINDDGGDRRTQGGGLEGEEMRAERAWAGV
ncbi:hypothetical protein GCM10009691_21410 [Brevibacterium picturae]|uniref:Uncharacterized protein n=1 Tax=Brevibacterium picturae TaxID=260553 RepID=A0ABN2BUW3_9MICO